MEEINQRLQAIEQRLSRIESKLRMSGIQGKEVEFAEEDLNFGEFRLIKSNSNLESSIGGYGLAWMGNIVLLLGIIFLTQWIISLGKPLIASIMGFAAVAALLTLHMYLSKSYSFLSFMFKLVGYFLLYYFTLRLHFFSNDPIIGVYLAGLLLLVSVVLLELFMAVRSGKEFFGGLAVLLGYFTALVSDKPFFMLGFTVFLALVSVLLLYRFGWKRTFFISMLSGYLVFLLWILNNPLMGNPFEVISILSHGYFYLSVYAIIYGLIPLFKDRAKLKPEFLSTALWLNSIGFSLIILLLVLQFFTENFSGLFALISLSCLVYSFILQIRTEWRFGSAFYALYGFMALSISIYGIFDLPEAHLFLAVESLLVVSMALWFRNKLIVIMNGILFSLLIVAYLASPEHLDSVNITYSLVPLITARILNWQKERLEIKTDMLRNLYLVIGFIAVLYTLQQLVPGKYISLSWTIAAVLYFLLSFILKNVKYRYMAIGTVIAVAFYLFLVDLARIEIAFRVVAFLFLALISIGVSVYYSRRT